MAKHLRHKMHYRPSGKILRESLKKGEVQRCYEAKEKLKSIYRISERELRHCVKKAVVSTEKPVEYLLRRLESRLDNIVYRLGFAVSRLQAQKLILDGKVMVDELKIIGPSYQVEPRETISCLEPRVLGKAVVLPPWLDKVHGLGKILHIPHYREVKKEDINVEDVIKYYAL